MTNKSTYWVDHVPTTCLPSSTPLYSRNITGKYIGETAQKGLSNLFTIVSHPITFLLASIAPIFHNDPTRHPPEEELTNPFPFSPLPCGDPPAPRYVNRRRQLYLR